MGAGKPTPSNGMMWTKPQLQTTNADSDANIGGDPSVSLTPISADAAIIGVIAGDVTGMTWSADDGQTIIDSGSDSVFAAHGAGYETGLAASAQDHGYTYAGSTRASLLAFVLEHDAGGGGSANPYYAYQQA